MRKLIQWKTPFGGDLKDIAAQHIQGSFPKHAIFAKEALEGPDVHCYVSGKKVPLTMKGVKAKAPILICVSPKSKNLANGDLKEEAIVFQKDGLIVVNKPPGLPSQSTFKAWEDSLYHQILRADLEKKNFPRILPYLGMHHRLDRETSGLLIFTTKPSKNKALSDIFQKRKILKTYFAIVEGEPPGPQWQNTRNVSSARHPKHRFFFSVSADGGQKAHSDFKVISTIGCGRTLIECRPKTGRTHQLRVHLRSDGLKIVGDHVYGVLGKDKPMRLHAGGLEWSWKGEAQKVWVRPPWLEMEETKFSDRFANKFE